MRLVYISLLLFFILISFSSLGIAKIMCEKYSDSGFETKIKLNTGCMVLYEGKYVRYRVIERLIEKKYINEFAISLKNEECKK